jgi:hypothetical protein
LDITLLIFPNGEQVQLHLVFFILNNRIDDQLDLFSIHNLFSFILLVKNYHESFDTKLVSLHLDLNFLQEKEFLLRFQGLKLVVQIWSEMVKLLVAIHNHDYNLCQEALSNEIDTFSLLFH